MKSRADRADSRMRGEAESNRTHVLPSIGHNKFQHVCLNHDVCYQEDILQRSTCQIVLFLCVQLNCNNIYSVV